MLGRARRADAVPRPGRAAVAGEIQAGRTHRHGKGWLWDSFELNPVGQQGLGFVANGVVVVNDEDSSANDRGVGNMVLEETLAGLAGLE